tara:strand:+ start:268 stop:585 length:318 start_codon:yes stop_codon:yes gene_type:complete
MEITLIISVAVNILFLLYCRFLIKNLNGLVQTSRDMSTLFTGFKEHVEMLHETEMFYGDSSLQSLIDHSKFVLETIDENSEILDMFESTEQTQDTENATEEKEKE